MNTNNGLEVKVKKKFSFSAIICTLKITEINAINSMKDQKIGKIKLSTFFFYFHFYFY